MNPQLTYLIVQARHTELVCRAERARLAGEARRARSASLPGRYVRRLLAMRGLRSARLPSVPQHASANPPHECLSCDP
jgi:hypothetical protein